MYKISKINSEYDNPKFVDLKSGYWYYNYNIWQTDLENAYETEEEISRSCFSRI